MNKKQNKIFIIYNTEFCELIFESDNEKDAQKTFDLLLDIFDYGYCGHFIKDKKGNTLATLKSRKMKKNIFTTMYEYLKKFFVLMRDKVKFGKR